MDTTEHIPTKDPLHEPPLIRALLKARYAMTIHDGMKVTAEGKSWTLDFRPQLAEIDAALQNADFDTKKPMLAPVRWADDADDFESVGPDAGDSA
jgi:hypothetical protein